MVPRLALSVPSVRPPAPSRGRRWSLLATLALFVAALPLAGVSAQHAPCDHPDALAPSGSTAAGALGERLPGRRGKKDRKGGEGEKSGKSEEDEKPKWDVNEAHGPTRTVEIDVDEGTWMSLDVSPDGGRIVFDLLGDLYSLPIAGGEAEALTSGLAWDMQPRFSPDGRSLAFTSDRGGGDNLWILDLEAEDGDENRLRQVTDEEFRLINSAAWSPDGDWLVARKHFTSARSLGAGEIWVYHRSGGGGLQVTERPNDQKDVGEPAFSPDGRFIYYSRDDTPGDVFEYNKDPNPGIYSIYRVDRESGESIALVTGAGGAVRPTPSPDGTRLAFVRRVRGDTVLFLRDLESGEEWPLWDGLERDMQETWAVHGVYPTMGWTPDSAALVLWAGGKLWRVDAGSGEAGEIAFRVRTSRTLVEPLRYPVEVAPARFEVKMLRWVSVSPSGDRVVYEALGKLWVRELPDGAPRRLTASTGDERELSPSFSRDGRWVVFATWDDRELGGLAVVSADGGAAARIGVGRGHFVEPALSPDGRWLVYRKTEGGGVRSPLYGAEPGIYRVAFSAAAAGTPGTPEKVTSSGVAPHFAAEPERVYLLRFGDEERSLVSIELDGSDERTHATSESAGLFRVSPDGRWVAWQERFQGYVAPFFATGKTVELAPDGKALPVARVSRDVGDFLHWSGDSAALHWSEGPQLFRRPLADSFAFLAGRLEEGDELPEPPAEGTRIGFSVDTDAPDAGILALVGARVVTMAPGGADGAADGGAIENGVILVEGNRIVAVGGRDQVAVPAGAHTVDLAGKTVIPGLIDVHWHGSQGGGGIVPQRNWVDYASLAFGVTTLHDPSNDTPTTFAAAELARAGKILAPRIFSTGTILYGAETPFMAEVDSLDDALTHVRRMQAVGAISVKSYNQPRRDQRQQVLAAAREIGMMVVPEGGSLFQHNMSMVADGHTGVEHSIPVPAVYDDVLTFWGATEVGYTPTLGVAYGGLWGENYWYAESDVWAHERLSAFVPREILDARSRRRVIAPEGEWNHFLAAKVAADLGHAGVPVQVGAHGQREGLAAHWEMWMLVQGGMTPAEALRAGTLDAARYVGLDGDLGSIEPGKLADLAILGGNPLADVRQSDTVERVVLNGRIYDATMLDRLWPDPAPRQPFYWERGEDCKMLLAPGR